MDGKTPGYLMRKELQRGKLRGRAERWTWEFKIRFSKGKGSELARM